MKEEEALARLALVAAEVMILDFTADAPDAGVKAATLDDKLVVLRSKKLMQLVLMSIFAFDRCEHDIS